MSLVIPVGGVEEYNRKGRPFSGMKELARSPVDLRVQGVVLNQIHRAHQCALLASATSPSVVIGLIPGISLSPQLFERQAREKQNRVSFKQTSSGPQIPIGLARCELFPPLNSILQLLLFLPAFRDLFSFAPRSCQKITDFIAQYLRDQEGKRSLSVADSNQLLRLLIQKMPDHFFRFQAAKVEVTEFLFSLTKSILGSAGSLIPNSLAFKPEWNIFWDSRLPFSCAIDIPSRQSELFVSVKNMTQSACSLIQRQFFTKPDSYCYDLDAFIEYRPDGKENRGDYITYLKPDGGWYQCDDERITPMRSNLLNLPLSRSILLHYKRIWPK